MSQCSEPMRQWPESLHWQMYSFLYKHILSILRLIILSSLELTGFSITYTSISDIQMRAVLFPQAFSCP